MFQNKYDTYQVAEKGNQETDFHREASVACFYGRHIIEAKQHQKKANCYLKSNTGKNYLAFI